MEKYLTSLLGSDLPVEPWVAALALAAMFFINYEIARSLRAANDAQHTLVVEDWSALNRGLEPKYLGVQILYLGLAFWLGLTLGGPVFTFLVGGLMVRIAFALGLNLQGLWSIRAMARPNAVTGVLTFSTAAAFQRMAHRSGGAALTCLLLGLALGHMALLGGAFFLAAPASGFLRRARLTDRVPKGPDPGG